MLLGQLVWSDCSFCSFYFGKFQAWHFFDVISLFFIWYTCLLFAKFQWFIVHHITYNLHVHDYCITSIFCSIDFLQLVFWQSVYIAAAAPNHTCKCKEQEWEVSPTTPGWRTWCSIGCFTSHWSCPCPSWCAIQFDLIHIFKRTCTELVGAFSRACFSWWKAEEAYCRWCQGSQKVFDKEKMRSNSIFCSSRSGFRRVFLWPILEITKVGLGHGNTLKHFVIMHLPGKGL